MNEYINNPERAVDADLTNYASFSNLAALGTGCGGALRVQLADTVPATDYRAGLIIGNAGLLDLGVLSALCLRTYRTGVVLYYRLRQVDLDGREQLLPVATLVATTLAEGSALYPNPATEGPVSLGLPASVAAGTTVAIYSSVGQLLCQQFVSSEGQPTAGLPTGIYQVVLRDAAGQCMANKYLIISG